MRDVVHLYLTSNYSRWTGLSGVLRITNEYLENDFKSRCAELVEQPGGLDAKDSVNACLSIKQGLNVETLTC